MKLEVDKINKGEDLEGDDVFELEKELLQIDGVNIWNAHVKGNKEVEMELGFNKFLVALSTRVSEDLDNVTLFKLYVLLRYLKENNNGNH